MDEPFLLVVNPRAGAGMAERRLPALRAALENARARFDLALTQSPRDATRLVREALRNGTKGIAVVGGDGTLNEAINGFFDESGAPISPDAWLGPLPCGTGGDFRRALGIPQAIDPMVTRMLWARPRRVDVGWLTYRNGDGGTAQRAFINIASFGLSGLVVQVVNEAPKWMGASAFLIGTLRAMTRYHNQPIKLRIDDEPERTRNVLTVAVANGRYFGGGMHIAPEARIDDGLFDVISMEIDRLEAIKLTADVYRGTHLKHPGIRLDRAQRVTAEPVDAAQQIAIDVDGEAPGTLPATFEIKRGAVLLRG